MARPQKQTVDFFPHYCKHGKTIYILEQHYQARGYAFWFKLLEELGSHEGHCIDLNDEAEIEFLGAKTWFQGSEILEVLNLCAKIGAIDKDLWAKKIVWSCNFVANISAVYDKRKVSVPVKPVSDTENPVSDDEKPQSRVEYSKVEKSTTCASKMHDEDFNLFWQAYPRKLNKKKARDRFLKLDNGKLPAILEALEKAKTTDQWKKDKGQFIPHPTSWLNGERWEDEIPEKTLEDIARDMVAECKAEYGEDKGANIAMSRFEKKYFPEKNDQRMIKYNSIFEF